MPTYVSPFTGTVVTQTQISYEEITLGGSYQLFWPSNCPPTEFAFSRIIDVQANTAGQYLELPPANEGTQGADSLIRNTGSQNFLVYSYTQQTSWVIAPGEAWYFYLQDNTTTYGHWQNIKFGTGTSTADAETLAGYGLAVRDGNLAVVQSVSDIVTPPVLTAADTTKTYNWNGGNGTITLPAVSTLPIGWYIAFRNNGTGNLILQPQGSATINGLTNVTTYPGDSGIIMLDGSGGSAKYITIGLNPPISSVFTAATYDVDSIVGNDFSLTSFAPTIETYVALSGTRTSNLNITLPPITQLYILVNDTSTAYDLVFSVSGSTAAPITLGYGVIAMILSDGNSLYFLNESSIGFYSAQDGSAAAPSFTFTNDTSTGMYLDNFGILGLAANGTEMLLIDNSTILTPVVSTPAELRAGLISGGTF